MLGPWGQTPVVSGSRPLGAQPLPQARCSPQEVRGLPGPFQIFPPCTPRWSPCWSEEFSRIEVTLSGTSSVEQELQSHWGKETKTRQMSLQRGWDPPEWPPKSGLSDPGTLSADPRCPLPCWVGHWSIPSLFIL